MAELSEIIKRMALEAMDGTKPARAVMGQVVKANPLKVKISDKLTLTEDNLVVPESLTDHYIYIDIEKDERKTSYDIKIKDDSKKTKDELTGITVTGEGVSYNDPKHFHEMPELEFDEIKVTKAKIKVYNALKKGDNVILLRDQGGQKFYIIDRTVRADDTD